VKKIMSGFSDLTLVSLRLVGVILLLLPWTYGYQSSEIKSLLLFTMNNDFSDRSRTTHAPLPCTAAVDSPLS
jgi:hypothetical protein